MMPFRAVIAKNLDKVSTLDMDLIAPSHGPIYPRPEFILEAYDEWVSGEPKNVAVVAYVSMHGSTERMVSVLVEALAERGVGVEQFNLPVTDIGKLAMSLVDAATLVVGTPTVLTGPHPAAVYAAYLANAIRPKVKFATVIGSYGWSTKAVEAVAGMIPNLRAEILPPVYCKGYPTAADLEALRALADTIAAKHKEHGLCE
jgi:flavorubredoxin